MGTSFRGPASSLTATGGLRPGRGGGVWGEAQGELWGPGWGGWAGQSSGPSCRSLEDFWVPSWLGCSLAWACGGTWFGGDLAWLFQPLCAPAPSTILVEPGCQAEVTETGDIRISVGAETASMVGMQLDPIHLSIFSHRFMSIAGEWLHSPAPSPAPCGAGGVLHAGQCVLGCLAGVCREKVQSGEGQKQSL